MSWTNEELSEALARYEQLCHSNGMTDKATFSYWDYARRFLVRPPVPRMARGRLPTDGGDGPKPDAKTRLGNGHQPLE